MKNNINIAVFISGVGSNARNIIEYFKNNERISISLIISSNIQSGAIEISKESEKLNDSRRSRRDSSTN